MKISLQDREAVVDELTGNLGLEILEVYNTQINILKPPQNGRKIKYPDPNM
jgi:hypothetical protein